MVLHRRWFLGLVVVSILSLLFSFTIPEKVRAESFSTHTAPDGRVYQLFIPTGYQKGQPLPLVVMLHGCGQTSTQFATATQMNQVAEKHKFIVAYPEQTFSANMSRCWNWFDTTHQSRNRGEPASIVGVVQHIKQNYSVDDRRVYVAGLSAGGAMSVILGATYPDVFTAIGVGSGLEYKAATSMMTSFTAMMMGGPSPTRQGELAYQAMGEHARVMPVIVFHGTADYTVRPINGDQVISQWAETNRRSSNSNITDRPSQTITGSVPNGRTYTRYIYKDPQGKTIMEKYMINNMGHAWSGGPLGGSFTDPSGPNASEIMWDFFKNHTK